MLEMLLATTFGVFITLVMINAHQSLLTNHLWLRERLSMTETAFVADRLLQDALHGSRRALCPYAAQRINLVNRSAYDYWATPFEEFRFAHSATSDRARAVAKVTPHPDGRNEFSDVLIGLQASLPAPILEHEEPSRFFDLAVPTKVKVGELAVACHEDLAALFQVTRVSRRGSRVHYDEGSAVRPGNCAVVFDADRACRARESHTFPRGALLIPYRPQAIYLATGVHAENAQFSLFRKRLVVADYGHYKRAGMFREEWLQGITSLRVAALKSAESHDLALEVQLQVEERSPRAPVQTEEESANSAWHTFTVVP